MTGPDDLRARWPLPGRPDLRDRLLASYSTDRGYHDVRHLGEVLDRLDELGSSEIEVVLAAWFHDVVYDGRPGAEERSARLAETQLAETDLAETQPAVDVAEVGRLVRLTEAHDPDPGDLRGEALCDADLAILAADPDRYAEYADGVRQEYADLPDADFRAGRRAVLEGLLRRPQLFRTAHARTHWEQRARANLARELAGLEG